MAAFQKKKTKNFMAPFHGWASTASRRLEPLRGGSLLFTKKFPGIKNAIHFIEKAHFVVEIFHIL